MPDPQLPQAKATDVFSTPVLHELQEAVKKRESDLKKLRTRNENAGLSHAVEAVDESLRIIKGDGPTRPGLKGWLGQAPSDKDPAQTDLTEEGESPGPKLVKDEEWDDIEPDYRTWEQNVGGVRELVAGIVSDQEPAAAVRTLIALEKGEKERDPRARSGALEAIRSARSSVAERVKPIAAGE